jgi:hypothetical protein
MLFFLGELRSERGEVEQAREAWNEALLLAQQLNHPFQPRLEERLNGRELG